MTDIRLPDGTIARFPDDMTGAEIEAVLQKQFPVPRPVSLKPGERARRGNGAEIAFSAVMQRYVISDAAGTPCGFRLTLDEALDFADILPPPRAPQPVKPEPKTAMAPTSTDALIAHDIDSHIRQWESRNRREQRQSVLRDSLGVFFRGDNRE